MDRMYTCGREEMTRDGKVPLEVVSSLDEVYQRMALDVLEEVRRNNGRSRPTDAKIIGQPARADFFSPFCSKSSETSGARPGVTVGVTPSPLRVTVPALRRRR